MPSSDCLQLRAGIEAGQSEVHRRPDGDADPEGWASPDHFHAVRAHTIQLERSGGCRTIALSAPGTAKTDWFPSAARVRRSNNSGRLFGIGD